MALVIVCAIGLVASCSANAASGVEGDLVFVGGPPPGSDSPPRLEPGRVTVYDSAGGQVASVSFEEGHGFSIALPPGQYRVVAESGDAICRDRHVAVNQDMYSVIHFSCDVR
jgi:hypothetical protein